MYSFEDRIRYSEVDEHGLLRPESLINYFQDCSTFQSEDGHVGIRYLVDRHYAWVVNYWQIEVRRYPVLGERVITATNPYELRGFMGLRNFSMDSADGERLAEANSVWSLINLDKMVPVIVPPEMSRVYELGEKFSDMEYLPRKILLPKDAVPQRVSRIEVGESHLDSNHHLNNAQYVRFVMQLVPKEQIVCGMRVEYKKQALLGDTIDILAYPAEMTGTGEKKVPISMNGSDGKAFACMELTLRPRRPDEESAWVL